MRRRTFFAATTAAVVAGGIGAYSAVAGDGSGGRTFTVHERGLSTNYIPAASGSPLGDVFVLSADILDDDGAVIGRDGGACTVTNADGSVVCNIAVRLPGGQLTIGGLANGPDNVFAITGGTGIYRNARGEAHAVDTSPLTSNVTISLIGG